MLSMKGVIKIKMVIPVNVYSKRYATDVVLSQPKAAEKEKHETFFGSTSSLLEGMVTTSLLKCGFVHPPPQDCSYRGFCGDHLLSNP